MNDARKPSRQERRAQERAARKVEAKLKEPHADERWKRIKAQHRRLPREHTTFHEAAHAVVAYAYGVPVRSIRAPRDGKPIHVQTDRGTMTYEAYVDHDWDAYFAANNVERGQLTKTVPVALVVAMAGFAANRMQNLTSNEHDRLSASDDFLDAQAMFPATTPLDTVTQTLQDATQIATNIIARYHEAAERVAAELHERDLINGRDIETICATVFARVDTLDGGDRRYLYRQVADPHGWPSLANRSESRR